MITRSHHFPAARGAALIAVLWLIAILAMACIATLRVISFDMELATSKVHGSRARQIAEMGIAIGSNAAVKRADPLLRQMNEESGEGFEVKITSEGARFNINHIVVATDDKALLRTLFIDWGLDLDTAQEIADAFADWADADDNVALNGAEKDYYLGEGRINQPFNRPFYSIDEMRLVRGMEKVEAVKPDWRNWFTVWSAGPLDINEAPAELLAAAAEIPVERADIVPETVRGTDGIRDTTDDVPFEGADGLASAFELMGVDATTREDIAKRIGGTDATARIESIGHASGAKRRIVVILANKTGRPALLDRTEEIIP